MRFSSTCYKAQCLAPSSSSWDKMVLLVLGQEVGGIFQDVDLDTGVLTISADIGVRRVAGADVGGGFNGQAGIFQLLVDGVVVDTHDFGAISFSGETKHDSLTAALSNVSSGTHEIHFLITGAGLPDTLLGQYIDNVSVSVSANGLALSTEAGHGTAGFDDAVVAIGSTLDLPLGVASYAVGNLFIADALNPPHPAGGCLHRHHYHGGG